jgi:hypothetical protein
MRFSSIQVTFFPLGLPNLASTNLKKGSDFPENP